MFWKEENMNACGMKGHTEKEKVGERTLCIEGVEERRKAGFQTFKAGGSAGVPLSKVMLNCSPVHMGVCTILMLILLCMRSSSFRSRPNQSTIFLCHSVPYYLPLVAAPDIAFFPS